MSRGLALVAGALLVALPWALTSYQLGLLTKMLIFAIFAMSLNLILGYAGLPSLGHAAYFGVAAYTTALLSLRMTANFWVDFVAGLVAAAITAALFGLLALRAQGSYLLMITLALAQVLWGIAFGWRSLTGGDDGLPGIPRPTVGPWRLGDGVSFYYFILIVFALAVALMWIVVRSPFGRALIGIRESARRMEVLGYNVWLHKYVAFILAGTLGGLSGALFVYYNGFVSPAYLSIVFSAMALIMVILGGAGTLLGPAVGSAAIVFLENGISAYTERWLTVLGLIYVAVTLFAPAGIVGFLRARRAAVIVALGLIGAPLAMDAQPAERTYRIGILETTGPEQNAANLNALREGLREHGYVEGKNLAIVYRSAEGRPERFADLAAELVRLKVDLIVTRGTPAALAAKNATATIPIVMASSGDPLASGVVTGLSKPGGNVTGLSANATEIEGKRLELLRQLVPRLTRVAGLFNMGNPIAAPQWDEIEKASRTLGIQAHLLDARKPEDLPRAFEIAAAQRFDAVAVGLDTLMQINRKAIVDLAATHRLPAVYQSREFVDVGGLMTYAVSYPHMYRRAAGFVARIFKGARPADLPIEQPSKFELVINAKTAKALGLTVPPSLLLRADQVIQ